MRVFYEGDRGGGARQEEPVPVPRDQWLLENAIHEVPYDVWDSKPRDGFNMALDKVTEIPEEGE